MKCAVRLCAAVLVAVVVTAACGGSSEPAQEAAPAAPPFTQVDVDFVVHLSQHHSQALHLTELAASRARSAVVKTLATEMAAAYAPQVDTLAGWIRAWAEAGAELPAHGIDHHETGPGMLPERAVTRLETLKGAAFDREFRVLMVRHHRGGLALVDAQLAGGINPDARALAERLRAQQNEQLTRLK